MGSHAGCTGGSCGGGSVPVRIRMKQLLNLPNWVPFVPEEVERRVTFFVGVNQIELADHGSQDYKFLPEVKDISHQFRQISAGVQDGWRIQARATLNPSLPSKTAFKAADPDQSEFFPARWSMELMLQLDLTLPWAKYLPFRSSVSLISKEPLKYETTEPLKGFPPLYGPAFETQADVPFFDAANPDSPPVMIFPKGHQIIPENRLRYNIRTLSNTMLDARRFRMEVAISAFDVPGPIATTVAVMPSRGVEVEGDMLIETRIGTNDQHFTITGEITDPAEPHIEVTLRPFSTDPAFPGASRHDIHLPEPEPFTDLGIAENPPQRVTAGDRATLTVTPRFAESAAQDVEYIWVAPHGVPLVDAKSTTPQFDAPDVPAPTDIWFTLFLRRGEELSKPYKLEYRVDPRP